MLEDERELINNMFEFTDATVESVMIPRTQIESLDIELTLALMLFFFNDTATTEIYTLSLHDALPFFACPTPGQPCVSTIVCGDLKVTGDEACDDGNTKGADGCSAECKQVEGGYTCPTANELGGACQPVAMPKCGDGLLGYGEYCDDGNT